MQRIAVAAARVLLALPFLVFGLNTVLWSMFDAAFFEPPADMPEATRPLMEGMQSTGFMNELRGMVEFLAGLLILTGVYAPLGLVLLAPILVHIVLYHQLLDPDPGGRVFSYVLLALALFLAWTYRAAYAGLLRPTLLPKAPEKEAR